MVISYINYICGELVTILNDRQYSSANIRLDLLHRSDVSSAHAPLQYKQAAFIYLEVKFYFKVFIA